MRWRADDGQPAAAAAAAAGGRPAAVHRLRWETLGRNRDGQQAPPFPDPAMLEVVTYGPPGPDSETGAAGRGG